ncbi:efflux transporter transcriptional repressor VdeR [Vibrio parahaemolyticus]|uniref:efflux transporter transcriptional repressor VdeR n=1 Tax=Vibrio parahaemolyticus TaxID=670 RepID=UPI0022B38537|nr:efflux transporter transcriptional repressor VdeR [Vibrio parahaemolyticus]MCZ6359068.1 efflux transporter transcriptional repressor VdeR [Vibrio parahaemolyticus]MCZ6363629.1 efflux transporter transcriptional repressor VdeR [Vibrio parahaemolyticus]
MNVRKQGRRSAEAAEQTKCLILKVAADMFCELGYERVSLRNISEKAGVSHSLIRHHFGSKEKIWQAVSDAMDEFLQNYMAGLINEMPENTPSNSKIYLFMVRMLAFALVNPHPVQMIADSIRQDDNALFDYFLKSKDEFAEIFTSIFAQYNSEFPEAQFDQWESKWQMLIFAHGAVSLAPMMQETWPDIADNREQLLIKHWELFNTIMATQFRIAKEDMIHPSKLEDIVIDMCCTIDEAVN